MSILDAIRKRVKSAGSQRAAAESIGISQQYLNDVLRGRKQPGPKFLAFFGYERTVKKSR
jgi:DNA-binding transcriptional regulator YdaS (Cro superfamily)